MSSTHQTQERPAAPAPTTGEGQFWERRPAGALPWVLGAVGLLGLGLVHDVPIRHSIESNLEDRSRASLDTAGAQGVSVDFTGRDGVLTGTLPAGTTADDLVTRIEALDGVRVVQADLGADQAAGGTGEASATGEPSAAASATSEPTDAASASVSPAATAGQFPSVTAEATGGTVTLTGSVPSQADADALVAAAAARYGEANVVNRLTVDAGLVAAGLSEFGSLLGALGARDEATAALAQGRLTLSGTVGSDEVKGAVEEAGTAVTGDAAKVTSRLTVGATGSGTGSTASPSLGGDKAAVQAALNQLPTISFQTGSATLTGQGWQAVRQAAQVLKDNPQSKVRVQGHTDDIGDAVANQQLSTARARAVREALHGLGIDHDRMSFIGYGETRPLVPNTSEANRLVNRRVQFQVL